MSDHQTPLPAVVPAAAADAQQVAPGVDGARRSLLGLAALAPAAYAVTTLAVSRSGGSELSWFAELPRLAMLGLCGLYLYRAANAAWVAASAAREATRRTEAVVPALLREEQRLAQLLASAQATGRAKSAFLARLSHHLRTPMNGILATTELALDGDLSPEQRDLLGTARDSGRALLAALDQVLDAARIEAGQVALARERVELHEVLAEVVAHQARLAGARIGDLACRVPPALPRAVVGDPRRLVQVVDHLLGAVLGGARRGPVVLTLDLRGAPAEFRLRITIAHTGPGVPMATAGEPDLDGPALDEPGDLGLGPSIAAQLVVLMGGRLTQHEEPGLGRRVELELPVAAAADAGPWPSPAGLAGATVLLADANMTTRTVLAETLGAWGAVVHAVEDGREALDVLEEILVAGGHPALVLLAQDLPQQECLESALRPGQPVILLGDGRRQDGSGGRPTVARPVLPRTLAPVVESLLSGAGAGPPARPDAPPAAAGRPPPLRVLVVEDNPVGQKVAQRLLGSWGHTVWVAGDGQRALDMLGRQAVDLVLMDLSMPIMDGLAATRALRRSEQESGRPRVPVFAMTAHAERGDRERCLAAGMDGHLAKPLRGEELAAVLASMPGAVDRTSPASTTHATRLGERTDRLPAG